MSDERKWHSVGTHFPRYLQLGANQTSAHNSEMRRIKRARTTMDKNDRRGRKSLQYMHDARSAKAAYVIESEHRPRARRAIFLNQSPCRGVRIRASARHGTGSCGWREHRSNSCDQAQ